jgi:hypothetical protein
LQHQHLLPMLATAEPGSQLLAITAPAAYFTDHIIAELADHSLPMAMATHQQSFHNPHAMVFWDSQSVQFLIFYCVMFLQLLYPTAQGPTTRNSSLTFS